MPSILIVDDDVTFGLMLKTLLEKNQYQVDSVCSPVKAKQIIRDRAFDIVLTDMRMPEISGLELIGPIKNKSSKTQIILMTSYADVATAIRAIKQGAFDYISKPIIPDELLNLISDALNSVAENDNPQKKTFPDNTFEYFDGISGLSQHLKEIISLVAPTPMSVLIMGESGTGKEFIARLIHRNSQRSNNQFVAVDCGAIPKELAASEFFGHVKGSFTGAIADKTGFFEMANGGTLFLDEIGNLSYQTQIQLLRALQEPVIRPVGSNKSVNIDVRIITATNEDLSDAMEKGAFRKDLYHRLNEFQITAPRLSERKEDIMQFAYYFLKQANTYLGKSIIGFDAHIEQVFLNYEWPGNLRELKNIVKRATLLAQNHYITLKEIPSELYESRERQISENMKGKNEPERIVRALEATEYNKSRAARLLNIDRKTLYNKLKLYHIDISDRD